MTAFDRTAMRSLLREALARAAKRLPPEHATFFRRIGEAHFHQIDDGELQALAHKPEAVIRGILMGRVFSLMVHALAADERRTEESRLNQRFWSVFGTDLQGNALVEGGGLEQAEHSADLVVALHHAMDDLRITQAQTWEVLCLRFYGGLVRREICEQLEMTAGKVRQLEETGLALLRKTFKVGA